MDDLQAAQEQLSHALDMARVGEDPGLRKRVREDGEAFFRLFTGLLRMTRVHNLDNHAFDQPCSDVSALINSLHELLGAVHLVLVEDQVYLNEIRVRRDRRDDDGRSIEDELKRHNVGGISFHSHIFPSQIKRLVSALAAKADPSQPRTALAAALAEAGVPGIELSGIYRFVNVGEEAGSFQPERARDVAEHTVHAVEDFWDALASERVQNALPGRRVVTELLDVSRDAGGLLAEPEGSTAHAAHALRVCQLALLIGRSLGMDEGELQDLGLAALFHDAGYAAHEGAVPARGGQPAQPGYAPPYERHTTAGARLLLRQKGFSEAKIRRVLAALEHHRDATDPRAKPSLFARILRITEDYDNLIRVGTGTPRQPLSPAEALARMARHAGDRYDAALFQVLVNRLGRFPPGTLLQLADGRVVRSLTLVRSPETFDRPLTAVMRDAQGQIPAELTYVDLTEEGQVTRVLRRLVVG